MFDTAYIHIGLDKTGSTAIQNLLNSGIPTIDDRILYPDTMSASANHYILGSLFSRNKKRYVGNIDHGRSRLMKEGELVEEDKKILLKYEEIFSNSTKDILVLSYEGFCALSVEEMKDMAQWIRRFARKIKCIVYCRDPISYAESAISQLCITGRRPDYKNLPKQDIKGIIKKAVESFGKENVIVRKFCRSELIGNDVRSDFLFLLGFDVHIAEKIVGEFGENRNVHNDNQSLSIHGIGVSEELVKYTPNEVGSPLFSWRYGFLLKRFPGPKFNLNKDEKEKILQDPLVLDSLEYLHKEFGIEFFMDTYEEQNPARELFETLKESGLYNIISEMVYNLGKSKVVMPKGMVRVNRKNIKANPKEKINLEAVIQNTGEETWWTNHLWPLRGGYYITERGKRDWIVEGRYAIPGGVVDSGSSVRANLSVISPDKPGEYELVVSLVQEHVAWFDIAPGDFNPARVALIVE